MMSDLKLLAAAPTMVLKKEAVDAPELGGAVLARGLMGSELFAVQVYRDQALRRQREAQAHHARLQAVATEGAPVAETDGPQMSFDELRSYGLYISHMLACSVTTANGMALYTAEEWEICGSQHPGLVDRLQAVVERLSGMNSEDVRKN